MKKTERILFYPKIFFFILIFKSKTLIYNISVLNEIFSKIAVFKQIILKYNILMKYSERIPINP